MKKFTERMAAPAVNNKYYTANNVYHTAGYGLPNCTCYAWGRVYEITGKRPTLSTNDGKDYWNHKDGYARGKTPRVGAVACWKGGADKCGHVAVVERIEIGGAITVSESCYGGTRFRVRTIPKPYSWGAYTFQGFIYPCPELYPDVNDIRQAILSRNKTSQFDVNADGRVNTKDILYRREELKK